MAIYNDISVDDVIRVRITNIVETIGAFVKTPNGHYGLIRLNDFAWFNQTNILKSFSVDDELDVKVMKKLPDGKLNLSRKALIPNPKTIEKGEIHSCLVKRVEPYGLIVQLGDFTALVPQKEQQPRIEYSVGDKLTCVVIDNIYDTEKHYNRVSMSVIALHDYVGKQHNEHDVVKGKFKSQFIKNEKTFAFIELDSIINVIVPANYFIEPYRSNLLNNEIEHDCELDFDFSYNEDKRAIKLDMRPIERKRKQDEIDWLTSQLERGDIVEAEVLNVNDQNARILISNTNVEYTMPREELSPNKVIRASDEVFVGEHIKVAYLGEGNELSFSRRFFVKDKYSEDLYDLSEKELLATMDLTTNKFVGKIIEIKSDNFNTNYFVTNLMTVGESDEEQNGKLLIDPINGKSLIAVIDNRLRNFFVVGEYYEVELSLARKEYRINSGTPYMFSVTSNNIKEAKDPYKESVLLSFKQHTSPNTNTSVANLLEEVGKNLYSSKKRMFFELLQNADDAASINGVKVKLQIADQYFVLTHDGYAFNQHDFESITSAAKSTKRANEKKTGYKGIGFKSVFTNSHSVYITSGGYKFSFDKECEIYKSFEGFYFLVNDIDNDEDKVKQADFLKKYSKYKREFNGVKDIPWQLLPVWSDNSILENKNSIFSEKENVSIALKMDNDTLLDYSEAIKEVFNEPRFMLFLRNTNRVQLIREDECLTIQKNKSDDGNIISLVNSFDPDNRIEDYKITTFDRLEVSDEMFKDAGVLIKREERLNNRGEKENYLVRIDTNGSILGEVSGIPDRIASTKDTTISYAVKLDSDGHIIPLDKESLSLYAYLPMNEHRFKFPFYINADFIPKSDREGVQSDNPWNHFIFYTIGKTIVKMVASYASVDDPEYLNLLPVEEFQSSSQDTSALVEAFNRGYKETLEKEKYILNDVNESVASSEIIYDASGLAEAIGPDSFYTLIGTVKHLPSPKIKSDILARAIFNIEKCTIDSVYNTLTSNLSVLSNWIKTCSEDLRNKFYEWLVSNEKTRPLISSIPTFVFGDDWKNTSEITVNNKCLILTDKIEPMKDVLSKLGFIISDNSLDSHQLCSYISKQDEKTIFAKIQETDISGLSFDDRLKLFLNCANFDEVGKETLRKWSIFRNQNNVATPLLNMFSYYDSCPQWLYPYMLNAAEKSDKLNSYLIPLTDIYSSVVENNIDDIITKTDIINVYNVFSKKWSSEFTAKLFKKPNIARLSLLSIVEQSNDATKVNYIKTFSQLDLSGFIPYDNTSFEYRWIRLASLNDATIAHARSIISIDEKSLSSYAVKDELTIQCNNTTYQFSLSKILPAYAQSSVLTSVVSDFVSINRYEEIFAQSEASLVDVRNKLLNLLSSSTALITEEQYCFLMAYRMSRGYKYFDNTLKSVIRVNDESLFTRILDKSYDLGLGESLGNFVKNGGIIYPFQAFIGTYFNCDEYTLSTERIPEFIKRWANTEEKQQFLIQVGLHSEKSAEITRRKSFIEKKDENLWNITDSNVIRIFLHWVANTFDLPITDKTQVGILEKLFTSLHIQGIYNEEDFSDAKEWTNELYLNWKKEKEIKIYIIEGQLPYRGIFENKYVYKGYVGEHTYFRNTKTIYISSNREAAALLSDVYSDRNCSFTKDDWNEIFLVSADIVKQKDELIAELKQKLEEAKKKNRSFDENDNDDEYGNAVDRDNIETQSRAEINKEARNAAKDYLDSLSDYDCSDWDPNAGNGLVKGLVKYKDKTITLVVTSSIGRKLYLHPRLFTELMTDKDNLLLNYGYDKRIHQINFDETFKDNKDVNLIFDADIITHEEFAYIANRYKYSKKTCFVIENITYSASDQIKGFGLNEKVTDSEVYTNVELSDIFDLL